MNNKNQIRNFTFSDIRHIRPNIGTIIFGAVFLYMIITVILFLTRAHVNSFQVISGPLAKNRTYTALAVREETIVTADAGGYITYYARENSKVKKYGAVYSVSPNAQISEESELSDDSLRAIGSDVRDFSASFEVGKFNDTYSFKNRIEGRVLDNSLLDTSDLAEMKGKNSVTIGSQTIATSPSDGIVSYTLDGYEGFDIKGITPDDMDRNSYKQTVLKTNGQVRAGQQIYKIVNSEKWTLIIQLTARQIIQLADRQTIRVKFLQDGSTQTAAFSVFPGENGEYYGKLDFSTGLLRFIDSRFIEIELVTNTATGLKVPVTSIVTKTFYVIPKEYASYGGSTTETGFLKVSKSSDGSEEVTFVSPTLYELKDGKYYVDTSEFSEGDVIIKDGSSSDRFIVRDTAALEGVYSMNKGYAVFRKVNIIDKNEQFCLVESGTSYGITQFDFIVENSSDVKESDITTR